MKNLSLILIAVSLGGCVTNDAQIKAAIQKNPDIVFNAIEENPERFLEVVNRAAQSARKKEYEARLQERQSQQEKDLKNPKQPKLGDSRRLMGTGKEKITIVEYADFQCPACRMAYESLLEFKLKYKGQVQFYFKHMPLSFHKEAMPAAVYFEAVRRQGPDKAMKFYEYIFQRQDKLGGTEFLKKAAREAGADMAKLAKDVSSEDVKKTIAEDMQEFEAFGFTGTPVVIVNGVALNGAPRLEDIEKLVEKTSTR